MKRIIIGGALALALFVTGTHEAYSQCKEVVWPENPEQKAKAEESKVLYEDALRANQLKQAKAPFNWLLTNVPNHHSSLYINGAELYQKLASQEKDPARKQVYVDSLMIIYDLRIKNCGDEANVLNRKAISFLQFSVNDKPKEALEILDKAFELNKVEIIDQTIVPYFQVVRLNVLKFKTINDEQILQRYDNLIAIVDAKIQKAQSEGKPIDKLQKSKSDIDEILMSIIKVDCDFVKKNMEPKFRQNPNDMGLAKKIFAFMLQGKCTDDPLWLEAAEKVHANPDEPKNCSLAKNLGIIYITKDDFTKAEQYLKEAQGICTEGSEKADILMYLGSLESRKGSKSGARDYFRQAAAADAGSAKQAYEKIGDLYLNSFDACKQLKSKVDDRLVYLLAYDYYQKAGDGKKMAIAKEGFPSKEEIFEESIQPGTSKSVGCWIGESTTIRTRN